MNNFIILTPVYNDWDNLNRLLKKINIIAKKNTYKFKILVINDFSTKKPKINFKKTKNITKIEIFNLSKNVGSQRAIAIGLRIISKFKKKNKQNVIIMDADGQDNPVFLKSLINKFKKNVCDITVVERANRNEPAWFRVLYILHKTVLFIFTGHYIRFGNFSLINFKKLKLITNNSDSWAAYPSAIVNNIKVIKKIRRDRSIRFLGQTKMNLKKLFFHSSRVFSVFTKKILLSSIIYSLIIFYLFNIYAIPFILLILICNIYNFFVHFLNMKEFKSSFSNLRISKIKIT